MNTKDMKKVIRFLKENNEFILMSHINPEGDSIGSQLAMYYLLKNMGKTVIIVNQDVVPKNMKFLSGAEKILSEVPAEMTKKNLIILDCPVRERVGVVGKRLNEDMFTINIDHHVSNKLFGDINWVESNMSSVGEMIFHLAKAIDPKLIDKNSAEAMYAAIVTDTGMFNYENTSAVTHNAVSEIIALGVSPPSMYSDIFEQKSSAEIRLLGRVLSTLMITEEKNIAYMTLTKETLKDESAENVPTDGFINFARSIKGVEVGIFFRENVSLEDHINVSFRSSGEIDVNKVAAHFKGGGHPKASGCVLNMPLEDAKIEVISRVKKALRQKGIK